MLEDILSVYKISISKTIKSIKDCPFLIILTPIYFLLIEVFSYLSLKISFAGGNLLIGFVRPVGYALLISSYFQMLEDGIIYKRINFKSLPSSFGRYFYQVYSVFFILIILDYLLMGVGSIGSIDIIVGIIINVVFSSVSEGIYIEGDNGISAFQEALVFMKENFIHWTVPTAIVIFGLEKILVGTGNFYFSDNLLLQNIGNSINSFLSMGLDPARIGRILIFEVILSAFAIFRYHMYKMLRGSSIRKRKFQGIIW